MQMKIEIWPGKYNSHKYVENVGGRNSDYIKKN